jgi:hypothetical protein
MSAVMLVGVIFLENMGIRDELRRRKIADEDSSACRT